MAKLLSPLECSYFTTGLAFMVNHIETNRMNLDIDHIGAEIRAQCFTLRPGAFDYAGILLRGCLFSIINLLNSYPAVNAVISYVEQNRFRKQML